MMHPRRRRAFSLFEALLALALIASLSGVVFTFLFNLGRQRTALDAEASSLQGAEALFDAVETDLNAAIAGDAAAGAGVVGDETSLRLLTRQVAPPMPGAGVPLAADLQGVSYTFDQQTGEIEARRWSEIDRSTEASSIIATNVERVRLRYFDGRSWSASFSSLSDGGLPVAIELAIWFGGSSGAVGGLDAASAGRAPRQDPDAIGAFDPDDPTAGLWGDPMAEGFEEQLPEETGEPLPPPDRVRTIVIPDGPVSAWRGA